MIAEHDLDGLDPYDLLDAEAGRLRAFFTSLDGDAWLQPTRCEGWSVRDLLGHLRSTEDYHQACLDGTVADLLNDFGQRGATDLHTANALGIADYADVPPDELVEQWSTINADTRARLRARDGGDVDSTVGAYPARWQAFHVALELATHADDAGAPLGSDEPDRVGWRAAVSRFTLKEHHEGAVAEAAGGGTTHIEIGDVHSVIEDADFVELVAARPPHDPSIPAEVRAALSTMP